MEDYFKQWTFPHSLRQWLYEKFPVLSKKNNAKVPINFDVFNSRR